MLYCDIDDETLHLIVQIQLEDLENIRTSRKGKLREDKVHDADVALDTYKSELQSHAVLFSDRRMCKSIAKANGLDGNLISLYVRQEKQAARDREAAINLHSGGEISEGASAAATQDEAAGDVDDKLLRKLKTLYVSADADEREDEGNDDDHDDDYFTLNQPESSTWAASRRRLNNIGKGNSRETRQCISCLDRYDLTDVARCPCNHEYCSSCLKTLFKNSLTDETLFPPRCCGRAIPVDNHLPFLSPRIVGEFRAKEIEFSTQNRTYCYEKTCSTFIPPTFIRDDIATCPRCRQKTCVMCKGAQHRRQDCAEDTLTQDLLQIAAANGWQRCYSCRRVVELLYGCNHMTCPCGAQFCYLCGEPWKTCTCAQWNEERLYARANAVVNRDADAVRLDPVLHARRVETEARNLQQNHQCTHTTWRSRQGGFRCEECREHLPWYIYECTRCRIYACRRCRYNRL
ncbi:putative E3 ubiquitin-protein ligase ARI5 [Colletotrichum chlorophyti]|uniref:RBR-type E3 ubiquitin transferase n=1 Tax=Colletotrichum chlorophyti TaxID=708187 RepID=A0A1Q8RAI7_9PEZI|nr:putative E3 ubiquitin-protein ligase ARI5 [Colletotrichum chlorophyti]